MLNANYPAIDIDVEIEKERKKFDDKVSKLNGRRELAALVNQLATDSELEVDVGCAVGSGTIDSMYIDMRLTEDQHIDAIRPLLHAVASTRRFETAKKHNYLELSWMGWDFREKEKPHNTVLVRAWYGASMVCTKEPTGKMVAEMEVVCRKNGDKVGQE